MEKAAVMKYAGQMPQDISQSPEFNLYQWAKEEALRLNNLIDKQIEPPPEFYLDGRVIDRKDVINQLSIAQQEVSELLK